MIESFQNPKVKLLNKLKNKRARDQLGQFIVEGYRELLRALEGDAKIEMLFYSPALFLKENEPKLIESIEKRGVPSFEIPKAIFEKVSMRDRPDGLVAVVKQERLGVEALRELLEKKDDLFLCVGESIEKPGNLGSILRSCDAVRVDGLIVCDECTDAYNPNVVRASIGTLFTVPVFHLSSNETLALLKEFNVTVVTTSPSADKNYTDVDYTKSVAIAVGTEQLGLSDVWFQEAFEKVSIPMMGRADSLNVSSATTLLLYEVLRQRR